MQELIKIKTSEGGKQIVSARELHQFLEVKTSFGIWMKRMSGYGFVENIDYAVIKSERADNQVVTIQDFVITVDMAKELSMIQRTDKGKQARLYFIECEKSSKQPVQQLPTDFISALEQLILSKKSELILEEKVKEMQPKADLFDVVMDSKDGIDLGKASKILKMGYGRNTLFQKLRQKGVLMKDNTPYQDRINSGWFMVIETPWFENGKTHINCKTLVLQKGLDGIRRLLTA